MNAVQQQPHQCKVRVPISTKCGQETHKATVQWPPLVCSEGPRPLPMAASFRDRLLKVTTAALTATLYACNPLLLGSTMAMHIKADGTKYNRPQNLKPGPAAMNMLRGKLTAEWP